MAGYLAAAPLCTWLVAAYVTASSGKEGPLAAPAAAEGRLLSRSARRRRAAAALRLDARDSSGGLMSALRGSGIQGLMNSCLAFEPCAEFYGSNGASSFFGESGFSLFGPSKAETTRRQRRAGRASCVSVGNRSLAGTLPPEVRNLTALLRLEVHNNRLSGPLPSLAWMPLPSLTSPPTPPTSPASSRTSSPPPSPPSTTLHSPSTSSPAPAEEEEDVESEE